MPNVLHVLPTDAALSCAGLEVWLESGREPSEELISWAPYDFDQIAWGPNEAEPLPARADSWARFKPLSVLLPGRNPWLEVLKERRVDVVHLYDLRHLNVLCRAAAQLDLPVVLTWPRGGDPDRVPFRKLDRVLVGSEAQAERLIEAGCPEALIEITPVPVPEAPLPVRRAPSKGQPLQWVTAALEVETQSLALVLEAFLAYRKLVEKPATLRVMTTAYLAAEAKGLIEELGLADCVVCEPTPDLETLKAAFLEAHLGVFPLEPAEPDMDVGLTGPAWLAAGSGLPLVLGPEGSVDGFRDEEEALIAELDPQAIAERMQVLASRPHRWSALGQQAARFATQRVDYVEASTLPTLVYKELLKEATV